MGYELKMRVWRGDQSGGELGDYTVEVSEGEVVLDAIHRLQATQAGDLAVRWHTPPSFDPQLSAAGAHDSTVGALPEQQSECGHDHGLARTGLAGERRESGPERQRGALDDPEVADRDLLNHGRSVLASPSPAGRTCAPAGR